MNSETVDEFLSRARIADLITLNARRLPVPVPVWFEWDGRRARMFSFATSAKVRRATSDPRAWLVVHAEVGEPEDWVVLHGALRLSSDGWAVAERLARHYWDTSSPEARQALADWKSQAADLVAMELAPARVSRLVP